MRGIILAGGTGSRLGAVTRLVNKHCLPIYDQPMIEYAADVLRHNLINNITVVSSPDGIQNLIGLRTPHTRHNYHVQHEPGGIAQALACADDHSGESVAVILGDNVFLPSPVISGSHYDERATCFLYKSTIYDLTQLGVARFVSGPNGPTKMVEVIEKPSKPPSDYIVTGLYTFPGTVFTEVLPNLRPGPRGEYEIADVLNYYARCDRLAYKVAHGFWGDAGTPDGMADCILAARTWRESQKDLTDKSHTTEGT